MLRLIPLAAACSLLVGGPALSAVLAEGQVRNGFYWQKVQQTSGKIVFICRSTSDGKFRKHDDCNAAGAKRP